MKRLFFIFLVFVSYFSHGQNNIFPSTGNVGIGTTSPLTKLHVRNSVSGPTAIFAQGGDDNFRLVTRQDITVNYDGSILSELNLEYGTARNTGIRFHRGFSSTGGFLSFSTDAGYERMRITTSGNVGIGTLNPSQKLEVNGTIKTKEVNVTTSGWADYVFRPEYTLKPLSEVEAFIAQNGHLPNVPSEKEVLENGVNLLEMNVKILEKVEELTLYLIELKKEVKELKAEQNK